VISASPSEENPMFAMRVRCSLKVNEPTVQYWFCGTNKKSYKKVLCGRAEFPSYLRAMGLQSPFLSKKLVMDRPCV
jgi:hypothetical protein